MIRLFPVVACVFRGRHVNAILLQIRHRQAQQVAAAHAGQQGDANICLVPLGLLVIVHADLGAVEWARVVDLIRTTTAGEPLRTCRARRTLLEMITGCGIFPSPQQCQCTSDLKRGPIERTIRAVLKDAPQFGGLIVNCMGMRAEESPNRAKLMQF